MPPATSSGYDYLPLETPPWDGPIPRSVASSIGSGHGPVEIPCANASPLGNCYWNVAEAVATVGGHAVQGWLIQWLPNRLVVALHHAMWHHPTYGHLVDPTAKDYRDATAERSLFVQDDSVQASLDVPSKITPRFFPLVQGDSVLSDLITSWRDTTKLERQLIARMHARGARFDHLRRLATDRSAVPPSLEDFIKPSEDSELLRLLDQARSAQMLAIRRVNLDPSAT